MLASALVALVSACSGSKGNGNAAGGAGGALGGAGGTGITTTLGCLSTTPCSTTSVCPAGEECNLSASPPACAKLYCQDVGGTCSADQHCKQGLLCVSYSYDGDPVPVQCVDPARTGRGLGETCGVAYHATAMPGRYDNYPLVCGAGLYCTVRATECLAGTRCAGICQQRKGVGASCFTSDECGDNQFCIGPNRLYCGSGVTCIGDGGATGTCHSWTECASPDCALSFISSRCGGPSGACISQQSTDTRSECYANGYAVSWRSGRQTVSTNGTICAIVDTVSTGVSTPYGSDFTTTYREPDGRAVVTLTQAGATQTYRCADGSTTVLDLTICPAQGGGFLCTAGACTAPIAPGSGGAGGGAAGTGGSSGGGAGGAGGACSRYDKYDMNCPIAAPVAYQCLGGSTPTRGCVEQQNAGAGVWCCAT